LRDVADTHLRSATRANYDFAKLFRGSDTAECAQTKFLRAGNHAAAGGFDVFALQRVAYIEDRKIVRGQLLRIEENADLPAL
jgi:hypothetical protein